MVLYNSACIDVTTEHTPDPFVCHTNGKFYLTFTGNDRVPMWDVSSVMDFYDKPNKGPIWHAPIFGPQSERLWAPELHCLRGRWWVYFAAADKAQGNRSHRMYVLRGPNEGQDPHTGPWELLGPIKGMDQGQWAIDGTVCDIDGSLYFVYSGWPRREEDQSEWEQQSEKVQQLFILKLSDPATATGDAKLISQPTEVWERLPGTHVAINEGPQWLQAPSGQWRGLVYSCSASWTKHYKMATLQYVGNDPMSSSSWRKGDRPLLQNRPDGKGPYGPGHGCFLHAGGETVALFHATDRDTDGNQNRRCRMQRLVWTNSGPYMGGHVGEVSDVKSFLLFNKQQNATQTLEETDSIRSLVWALSGSTG